MKLAFKPSAINPVLVVLVRAEVWQFCAGHVIKWWIAEINIAKEKPTFRRGSVFL